MLQDVSPEEYAGEPEMMVNGIDMAADIAVTAFEELAPFATDSDCVRFFFLVKRLTLACDCGSIAGDARRLDAVLTGALKDIKKHTAAWTRKRFEHMTALVLAITTNRHGLDGLIDRGFGDAWDFFQDLAFAWRRLLDPNGRAGADGPKKLKEDGVTPAMMRCAKTECAHLKKFLESGKAGGVSLFGLGESCVQFNWDPVAR
jgi:hypothetical protein